MSARRNGAPFFPARFLVSSRLTVRLVRRLVGALRFGGPFRSSSRPSARRGVSGFLCVSLVVSCDRLAGRLVSLRRARIVVCIALSVITHRVRGTFRPVVSIGMGVSLRRWASSLVFCSIHIRAVSLAHFLVVARAWLVPAIVGACRAHPRSHASSLLSLPCVSRRIVSASRSSARSSACFVSPVGRLVFSHRVRASSASSWEGVVSFAWRFRFPYPYAPFLPVSISHRLLITIIVGRCPGEQINGASWASVVSYGTSRETQMRQHREARAEAREEGTEDGGNGNETRMANDDEQKRDDKKTEPGRRTKRK